MLTTKQNDYLENVLMRKKKKNSNIFYTEVITLDGTTTIIHWLK